MGCVFPSPSFPCSPGVQVLISQLLERALLRTTGVLQRTRSQLPAAPTCVLSFPAWLPISLTP